MKIGVFDSGRGGEFIAEGLRKLLTEHEFIVVNDRAHVPYGSRKDGEIIELTTAAIQPLLKAHCPVIVIACNTATMAAITTLRERFPKTKFIGIEPMVKPAAAISTTHHATVLATPLTLKSSRYQHLLREYASELTIDQPNAAGWAAAIEHDQIDTISFDEVAASITSGSDTLILACTHYITLKNQLQVRFPGVNILEPTEAIARQVTRLALEIAT
ncbi:MAG TPA: aspartate/glutamate racemase family protein [Patescibacteria group bacterium]|nr:aspartate/glutamate racemase family protein [Patescibacteria group bacterium]